MSGESNPLRAEFKEVNPDDESLSIVIYGETQAKAYECAEALFGGRMEEGTDVWKKPLTEMTFSVTLDG